VSIRINNKPDNNLIYDVSINPIIKVSFDAPIDRSTVQGNLTLKENDVVSIPLSFSYENNDSVLVVNSQASLRYLTRYYFRVLSALKSTNQGVLGADHIRE